MKKKEWLKNLVFLVPAVCVAVCAGWGLHMAANVVLPKAENFVKQVEKDRKQTLELSKQQEQKQVSQRLAHKKAVKGQPSDGVYSGSAVCQRFGYTVRLKAKFKDGKLVALYDMKMLENMDSANVSYMKRAWREMVKRLLKRQSDQVDTVSGATYSSQTIVQAYLDAYEKAVQHNKKSDRKKDTVKSEKTPSQIKVPSASSVPSEKIVDGSYKVSALCEPDEDEAFERYTLQAVVTFRKGKCIKIDSFSSDREANRSYYMKAASGAKGAAGVVQQIIKKQSAQGIQAVSGATCSSKTIVRLYVNALCQAVKQPEATAMPTLQPTEPPVNTPMPTETPKADDIILIPLKSGKYPQSVLVEPDEEEDFEEYTISADVVFVENRFAGFENVILSDESNRWYYTRALNGTKTKKGLLTQIHEKENDQLDIVSGATCTSKALIEMYARAWREAKK